MNRRTGRRPASAGESRAAILQAARHLFAERGYRGTTIRAIAQRARVDVALVHYFFGSKGQLFAAAVDLPVSSEELRTVFAEGGRASERIVRFYLERLFVDRRDAIMALLRAALGDPDCIPALRSAIEQTLVAGVADELGGHEAKLRAELVGALVVGLFVCRHVVEMEPLSSVSTDVLVGWLAPAIQSLTSLPDAEGGGHPRA